MGAFIYSPEEGTAAASFPDPVDAQTAQDRYDTVMSIQLAISADRCREQVGKMLRVLCEGYDIPAEIYVGRSEGDAPDVDGRVFFRSNKKVAEGEFVTVRITEAQDYDLVGERVDERGE